MSKILADVSKQNGNGSAVALDAKVTEKGGLSIYGLQRFPVTLYREQWEALFANADKIRAFIAANGDKLAVKNAASAATAAGRTRL